MVLRTLEIKRFFSLSANIGSSLIPLLNDFVKIENDKIYKTNSSSWIVYSITATNENMLVPTDLLRDQLKLITADTFTLTTKTTEAGAVVYLESKGIPKVKFALSNDYKQFPDFPEKDKDNAVRLDEPVLKAVGIAAKNVENNKVKSNLDYVHFEKGYVWGSDRNRFYFNKFEDLPTFSLDVDYANILSQFGGATFYQKNNYMFFEVGTIIYAFVKSEVTIPDTSKLFQVMKRDTYMQFEVKDLLTFLDSVASTSPYSVKNCRIDGGHLSFIDSELEREVEFDMEVTGDFKPQFNFLASVFHPYFKSLGKETVRLSPLHQPWGVSVWDADEDGFTGFISGTTIES